MNKLLYLSALGILILLAACGGSSSGSSTNTGNGTTPTPAALSNSAATAAPTLAAAPAATQAPTTVADTSASAAPTDQPTTADVSPTTAAQPADAPTTQAPANTGGNGGGVPIGSMGEVLKKACDALKAQPNVIIHSVVTGSESGEMTMQFAGMDSMSMLANLNGNATAMTVISPTMYTQEDGKWKKQTDPNGAATTMALIRPAATIYVCLDAFGSDSTSEAFKLGQLTANMALPDVVDGVPTLTYTANATLDDQETGKGTGDIKYWLDATDSLPRQVVINYKTDKGNGTATVTFKYDKPDIQAPIP